MTTVYLHVGMPKCGSSTLQSTFRKFDDVHRKQGVCYPRAFRDDFGYFSHRPLHNMPLQEVDGAVAAIAQEAKVANCEKIILSSEEFTNSRWDKENTAEVIQSLNRCFGVSNVRLVFLVRNHFSFVESVFSQFLKGGMFRVPADAFYQRDDTSISGYIDCFNENNRFDFFCYSEMIDRFRQHAPDNKIDVYSIDKSDLNGKDVIEVLCAKLGLQLPEISTPANARFSTKTLLSLHYANRTHGFKRTRNCRQLIDRLFPDGKKGFSPKLHVTGASFDKVLRAVEIDRAYFSSQIEGTFDAMFALPARFEEGHSQKAIIMLRKNNRRAIDELMSLEIPTGKDVIKIRKKMRSRAKARGIRRQTSANKG